MKIAIDDASNQQLRKYAAETLGMHDIPANAKRATLIAKIQSSQEGDQIEVDDEDPTEALPPAAAVGSAPAEASLPVLPTRIIPENEKASAIPAGMVRIMIAMQDKPGGRDPVYVAVNGRNRYFPRGKILDIPAWFEEVLSHATENHYEPTEDGKSINPIPREVQLYPYNVYGRGPELKLPPQTKAAA